jgi:hypothetical protein
MDTAEKIIYSNVFGTVTDQRIILNHSSGTEDIPVAQISSVSFRRRRNYIIAAFSFLTGLLLIPAIVLYVQYTGGSNAFLLVVSSLLGILSGIANWIGHHDVVIRTEERKRKTLKVEMSQREDGRQFVDAAQGVMIPLTTS